MFTFKYVMNQITNFLFPFVHPAIIFLIFFLAAKLSRKILVRIFSKKLSKNMAELLANSLYYIVLFIGLFFAAQLLIFDFAGTKLFPLFTQYIGMQFIHLPIVFLTSAIIFFVGYLVIKFIQQHILTLFSEKLSQHMQVLLSHIVYYFGLSVVAIIALQTAGLDLSALLGAAGVVGVGLGFAAQTSLSNIISGIFLLFEQSFAIGDRIEYQGSEGIVQSIDLFSVKIKTFDNQLIRIPNESILKHKLINVTYYDFRRTEVIVKVDAQQEVGKIKVIAEKAIVQAKGILPDPKPAILFKSVAQLEYINERKVVIGVRVWAKQADVFNVHLALVETIKNMCDQENIAATIE